MDEIVSVIGESPIIYVELTPLAVSIVLSDIVPQATVTILDNVEPATVEVKPDLPYYVQVYEWPDCPDDSGMGFSLPIDATDVLYANAGFTSLSDVKKALDYLLYVPPQITAIGANVPNQEIGAIVDNVTISWAYNKDMETAFLTDAGSLSPTLTTYSFTGLGLTATKSWSLQASDGQNAVSRSVTIQFLNKRYWGVASATALNSSDILSLSGELATSRNQARTISGDGKYIFFAWPATWGMPTFKVNGLQSTAWVQSVQSHMNSKGYTTTYFVFRSTTVQYGSGIIIEVT